MIVLVTGANGFLGSVLVEYLLKKTDYHVRCLVRSGSSITTLQKSLKNFPDKCEIVYGALNSCDVCARIIDNVDIVFHLASAKGGAPAEMFQGSSVTTKCLLEAIRNSKNRIKLIHCSSFSVYGVAGLKKGAVVDENTPLESLPQKRDTYAYSKWHQERLVKEYSVTYSIPTVILRPGVVYGPGGTPISPRVGLNLFGLFLFMGGHNKLPLTYVDNCAGAFVTVAEHATFSGEIFNVVDDDLITAKEFLSLYRKHVKKLRYIPVPYCIMWLLSIACEKYFKRSKGQLPEIFTRYKTASIWKSQAYNNDRLKQLGWMPEIKTREGLMAHMAALKSMT